MGHEDLVVSLACAMWPENDEGDAWAFWHDSRLAARVIERLTHQLLRFSPTHLAGVETRGLVLASALASRTCLPLVPVRKTPCHLLGECLTSVTDADYKGRHVSFAASRRALPHGGRVVIVDDWVDTGSTNRAVDAIIRAAGATTVGSVAVIDATARPSGNQKPFSFPFAALVTLDQLQQARPAFAPSDLRRQL